MIARFIALLALALTLACSAPADVRTHALAPLATHVQDVHVDAAFDAPDQAAIVDAVATWNDVLGPELQLRPKVHPLTLLEGGILIMRVDSTAPYIPFNPRGRTLAFTEYVSGLHVWIVRDRMTADAVRPITLHELGHVLGAADRDGPGLMHWAFDAAGYRCIDAATLREVGRWVATRVANGCTGTAAPVGCLSN